MKKLITLISIIATLTLAGCSITRPVAISNDAQSVKIGEICQTGVLFLPPIAGQTSYIYEAKVKAGITKVATVDQRQEFYVIYNKNCTVVTGE